MQKLATAKADRASWCAKKRYQFIKLHSPYWRGWPSYSPVYAHRPVADFGNPS